MIAEVLFTIRVLLIPTVLYAVIAERQFVENAHILPMENVYVLIVQNRQDSHILQCPTI